PGKGAGDRCRGLSRDRRGGRSETGPGRLRLSRDLSPSRPACNEQGGFFIQGVPASALYGSLYRFADPVQAYLRYLYPLRAAWPLDGGQQQAAAAFFIEQGKVAALGPLKKTGPRRHGQAPDGLHALSQPFVTLR